MSFVIDIYRKQTSFLTIKDHIFYYNLSNQYSNLIKKVTSAIDVKIHPGFNEQKILNPNILSGNQHSTIFVNNYDKTITGSTLNHLSNIV